ncbi:MAG: bacillithiol biosynthesis deacetylase BshB1 [Chitinophagales bacterium]
MKLDILAFGAHPDDVELSCSGTLLMEIHKGKKAGIIDLTAGEMGSRGTAEIRAHEAEDARKILGAEMRRNLHLPDAQFENNHANRLEVIRMIRAYRPTYVLCNAIGDRHPDHGRSAQLVEEACFLSGLIKIETEWEGNAQIAYRPQLVLHYIQDRYIHPDIVIDISAVWEQRMESIRAHRSQFYDPDSGEPETYISSKGFFDGIERRAREMGRSCGYMYAEGFTCNRILGAHYLSDLC